MKIGKVLACLNGGIFLAGLTVYFIRGGRDTFFGLLLPSCQAESSLEIIISHSWFGLWGILFFMYIAKSTFFSIYGDRSTLNGFTKLITPDASSGFGKWFFAVMLAFQLFIFSIGSAMMVLSSMLHPIGFPFMGCNF